MPHYINCPRCNNKISLDFINSLERINLTCPNCNTHIIMRPKTIKKLVRKKAIKLKHSNPDAFNTYNNSGEVYESDNQNTGVIGVFKKSFDIGKKVYDKLNEEYNNAVVRLNKQGFYKQDEDDEWDEEKWEKRARYAGFFEEAIIRQRLREKREQNSSDGE